jgi:hypothetical protein
MAENMEKLLIDDAGKPMPGASDVLCTLVKLCDQAKQAEAEIKDQEAKLARLTEEYRALIDDRIPDMMASLGVSTITLASGDSVKIKQVISASIPKDAEKKAEALEYIRSTGDGESLIKTKVEVLFGKGEGAAAQGLIDLVKQRGDRFSWDTSIHAQTLSAWVRERLEQGLPIDQEKLNLFILNRAEIKRK